MTRYYNLAKDLNNLLPAARSHVLRTARGLSPDKRLSSRRTDCTGTILGRERNLVGDQDGVRPFTTNYLLAAIDLRWTADGGIARVLPDQAIYGTIFVRTFAISAGVTLITLVLGFPLAWLLANLSGPTAARLILLVLLPFWTSILVRTAAWTVLLQRSGILNELLLGLQVIEQPADLMYTRTGLIIAMTHIQLPFTLLPIYSIMRTISPAQMRAAYSLGRARLPHSVVSTCPR